MQDFRNFYVQRVKERIEAGTGAIFRLDENKKAHVALYSHFFTQLSGNFLCTNKMYRELETDIANSVGLINADKRIVMDIYEPKESNELNREVAIAGFRRYLKAGLEVESKRFRRRMYVFIACLLIGIVLEVLLYGLDLSLLPEWVDSCVDIVATVFVWQFVGFMAYEHRSDRMRLKRMRQMIAMEYTFRKWE